MVKLRRWLAVAVAVYSASAFASVSLQAVPKKPAAQVLVRGEIGAPVAVSPRALGDNGDERMSSMGRLAHLAATGKLDKAIARARARAMHGPGSKQSQVNVPDEGPCDVDNPDCTALDDDAADGPAGGQAELSIAVDATGQHIVVGANDTRGFSMNPVSVSGFAYSDDGGATFVDGGTLPVNTGTTTIGTTTLPQVFGDPEVKYLGGSNFIYFSIMVQKFSATTTVQTMCFHRSTDYGHTWQGPFEITPASNPNHLTSGSGAPRDAADKEFADVDPDTGRVMMSWSNFTVTSIAPGGVEISTTYSDNVMAATPVWSARAIVAKTAADGQASLPRFVKGSDVVYCAWRRFGPGRWDQNVGFAKSTDNGATWGPAVNTTSAFFTMDQVLGNDRNNTSPSLAVDNSNNAASAGNVYVVYTNNNSKDGGDVMFQRSIDGGATFSAAVALDSRPGQDRPQWFPWVTVDNSTGRVWVFYYDQAIASSGDLTETTYVYSDNGGLSWSNPAPLTDRPFHAAYGNDTGQPNIGDYNQAVAQNGELFAVWAGAPPIVNFGDGQPSGSMTVPDIYSKRLAQIFSVKAPLAIGGVSFTETSGNGSIDPGERVALRIDLRNEVTNALSSATIGSIAGTLGTTTPGVTITTANASYPAAGPGATVAQTAPYMLQLSSTFVAGTAIDLVLNVTSSAGATTLLYRQTTGTPNATTIFSENFEGTITGWTTAHAGGNTTVPWTIASTGFMGNAGHYAFHPNANDGATSTTNTRFERLFSPVINVPANSEYVTLDFDVAYDTEDEPVFYNGATPGVQTYDGFLLRITDNPTGSFPQNVRLTRSVQIESFAEEFTSGGVNFYPSHMPRNSNGAYLQDLSAWGGYSNGFKHVHLKLNGMAGLPVQLRWEFTQDSVGICTDVGHPAPCGVAFDNIVMQSVVSARGTTTSVAAAAGQYSDGVTLRATVSPALSPMTPVPQGSVQFFVNGTSAGTATVDATGVAALSYTIGQPQGSYSITASFTPADNTFAASNGSSTLTVSREDATVTPPAAASYKVSSPGGSASFTLAATIAEVADGSLGNISNAVPVTFTLTPVGPGSVLTATATTAGGGVGGTLTASASFANVPPNVYDVAIQIGGLFYQGSGETVVSVYDPSLGFITGGGSVTHNGVAGYFGFNFKYKKGDNVQGNLIYVEHRATGDVVVKSNALDSLSIASTTAIVLGKATLTGVGGYTFRLVVTDNGEPGSSDQFGLQVTDKNGAAVPDLSFAPLTLSGGNIQVPHQ